jgi:hypothetical protein
MLVFFAFPVCLMCLTACGGFQKRIHERTITLRFLGIILKVFRFVGMVFYQVFLLSPVQKL